MQGQPHVDFGCLSPSPVKYKAGTVAEASSRAMRAPVVGGGGDAGRSGASGREIKFLSRAPIR